MKHVDLFSGIGGFSKGLEATGGFETVAFCEIEEYPRKVLKKHWPDVLIYEDVRDVTEERLRADGIGRIDVLTGGFPCQDISVAGKQKGIDAERSGLWSECARLLGEVRPSYAIFENVTALLSGDEGRWFQRVLFDISQVGYDAEWHCISASELGAHHHRDRVWIIAYPSSSRFETREIQTQKQILSTLEIKLRGGGFSRSGWREPEPELGRVANGIPNRAHRLKGLGNAVVPQIPELLGRAILEIHRQAKR